MSSGCMRDCCSCLAKQSIPLSHPAWCSRQRAGQASKLSSTRQQKTPHAAGVSASPATQEAPPLMHPNLGASADLSSVLSLDNIRQTLIRQEDTIIFSLIERAQFARNAAVYQPDAVPVPGFAPSGQRYSLLEYLLREMEQIHGKIRRYTSPDEQAFYAEDLPGLVLPPLQYAQVLAPRAKAINVNGRIMDLYLQHLLPGITEDGDDNNYGSSATNDVLCLQALSKRIHYGKFVAEAKFRAQGAEYRELIRQGDAAGLMQLLTDRAVERKVVERVRRKAAMYGQDDLNAESFNPFASNGVEAGTSYKVEPDTVAELYEQFVMPLTKEVQVTYLLGRLDQEQQQ